MVFCWYFAVSCSNPHAGADLRASGGTQYAFNLFSHNSPMTDNGYNEEEMKMVKETRKIWGEPGIAITATCIRVPIMRAHAESINLEFEDGLSEEQARRLQQIQECIQEMAIPA